MSQNLRFKYFKLDSSNESSSRMEVWAMEHMTRINLSCSFTALPRELSAISIHSVIAQNTNTWTYDLLIQLKLTSIEMYVHSGNMRMVGCVWVGISALVYVRIRINWVWIPEFTHFNRYFRSKRWVLMFVNKVFGNLNIGISYDNLILNRFKIQWFLVL